MKLYNQFCSTLRHQSASNSPFHVSSLGRGKGGSSSQQYHTSSLQRGGLGTITKSRIYQTPPNQNQPQRRMMPRSATLDDLEPAPTSYYEPVMWVQRPSGMVGRPQVGCHPCCCSQQYRYPQSCHGSASLNGSLPRYPPAHSQDVYDYSNHRGSQPGSMLRGEFRSHSVASSDQQNMNLR